MKKIKLISLSLSAFLCFSLIAGCGSKSKDNDGKTLYVHVPNGGYGLDWVNEIVEDWESENPGWTIKLDKKKTTIGTFIADVETGSNLDVFFTDGLDFQEGIYKDLFVDMTDILEKKVDGENGKKIGEKIEDFDNWKKIASKKGEGLYMMPWTDPLSGFVYDHDMFVEKGWLTYANEENDGVKIKNQGITYNKEGKKLKFVSSTSPVNYKEGDIILSSGKDGKYGTYDDGQPQTLAEFESLVKGASSSGHAFLWSGGNFDYTTPIFNSIFANYEGEENFRLFFEYEGDYTFAGDSEPTHISLDDNGYKVYQMEGIKQAANFMNNYLNNEKYIHPSSTKSSTSHTDAQGYFLTGYKGSPQNLQSAFLVESTWWEREAKATFKLIQSDGRGYGERDYRYMLFPQLPGQKGIDGNGNGTIFTTYGSSGFVIVNSGNEEKIQKAKDFCAYTLKDEYLRRFTVLTGTRRPYEYKLTNEDYNSMTPFQKTAMQIYEDKENIKILKPNVLNLLTPISYASSKDTSSMWLCKINGVDYSSPIKAVQATNGQDTVNKVFNGFSEYYNKNVWERYVSEYKRYMGIK